METMICNICKEEKPISEFPFRNKGKGTRRHDCKACHNKKMSNRYKENKIELDKTKEGKCCIKCGYNKCVEALDYHHIDKATKLNTVAKLATHYNLQAGLDEIKKCVLFCANCHREYHFLEKKYGITLEEFLQK